MSDVPPPEPAPVQQPQVLTDPATTTPAPVPPVYTTTTPPPPKPATLLERIKAFIAKLRSGPWWVKALIFVPFVVVATFYYRDKRMGNGFFADPPPLIDIDTDIKGKIKGNTVNIVYKDGTEVPADGMGVAVVSFEDDRKRPERLAAFRSFIREGDWPVIVFMNASGFDATGEPVAIRRVADGKMVYQAGDYQRVLLNIAKRDGSFTLYLGDKSSQDVSEKEWVEKYMRLKYQEPIDAKKLEKMSDAELKKRGYERITIAEARRRGLIKDPKKEKEKEKEVFPRPRVPER